MKKWEEPEIWELAVGCTKGSLYGEGEDHIRVTTPGGYKEWGNS